MKKGLTAVCTAVLILAMGVCALAADVSALSGDWYGDMFGIAMTLTLNEDGTYHMTMPVTGEETEGTWKLQGDKVIMDDTEDSAMNYDGKTLSMTEDDVTLTFSRTPVKTFTPAEPKTDAALEEYAGDWESGFVKFQDMTLDGAALGLDLTAHIEGADATISSESMDIPETVIACAFEDGSLGMSASAEEIKSAKEALAAAAKDAEEAVSEAESAGSETAEETDAAGSETAEEAGSEASETTAAEEESISVSFQLLQDGTIAAAIARSEQTVVFYLNPAEEAGAEETTAAPESPAETETAA